MDTLLTGNFADLEWGILCIQRHTLNRFDLREFAEVVVMRDGSHCYMAPQRTEIAEFCHRLRHIDKRLKIHSERLARVGPVNNVVHLSLDTTFAWLTPSEGGPQSVTVNDEWSMPLSRLATESAHAAAASLVRLWFDRVIDADAWHFGCIVGFPPVAYLAPGYVGRVRRFPRFADPDPGRLLGIMRREVAALATLVGSRSPDVPERAKLEGSTPQPTAPELVTLAEFATLVCRKKARLWQIARETCVKLPAPIVPQNGRTPARYSLFDLQQWFLAAVPSEAFRFQNSSSGG